MSSRSASSAPTIIDVAREAGVSIKTVSRVLNRERGVHGQTREQVLAVVARLKYRPKLSARALAGARSYLIGMLYYDDSAAFASGVQKGAAMRCREAGYHLVVESLERDVTELESRIDRMVSALRPDGMILTPPLCDNPQVLKALADLGTPSVLISPGDHDATLPCVCMDDVRAAEEVTELLIDLGHERIAFIRGATNQAASARRYEGFCRAMRARGLTIDDEWVFQGDFTFPSGAAAAQHLLGRRVRPTAVFASNDDMALGVLAAAQRLGLAVPTELSIVGFDDSPAATLVFPSLTTVRQPVEQMARVAVDLLITPGTDSEGESVKVASGNDRVVHHDIVVRDSTAALRARHRPGASAVVDPVG